MKKLHNKRLIIKYLLLLVVKILYSGQPHICSTKCSRENTLIRQQLKAFASFAVLAPAAAATLPTPFEEVGSYVAIDDSEEANATGPPWQHNRLTLATLESGRFD